MPGHDDVRQRHGLASQRRQVGQPGHLRGLPRGGRQLRRHRQHLRQERGRARRDDRQRARLSSCWPPSSRSRAIPTTRTRAAAIARTCGAASRTACAASAPTTSTCCGSMRWDQRTPLDETLRALDDVVRSGKVNAIGVSNTPAWVVSTAVTLAEQQGWTPFCALQVQYSLVARTADRELLADGRGQRPGRDRLGAAGDGHPRRQGDRLGLGPRQRDRQDRGRGRRRDRGHAVAGRAWPGRCAAASSRSSDRASPSSSSTASAPPSSSSTTRCWPGSTRRRWSSWATRTSS